MDASQPVDHTKRDSETFLIIGVFVILIGIPVLMGAWWEDEFHAQAITVLAAIALFIVGGGMTGRGLQLYLRLKGRS
jgi:formate-dependent nitrite reductase membrane component NrfD